MPIDWGAWSRIATGLLLFYTGCWFAYRTEFSGYGMKGGVGAYLLIVLGLLCGFWDRLW